MEETKQIGGIKRVALTNAAHMGMNTELYERIMKVSPEASAPQASDTVDTFIATVNQIFREYKTLIASKNKAPKTKE